MPDAMADADNAEAAGGPTDDQRFVVAGVVRQKVLFDARPTRGVGNKTCDELPEIVSYHIHGARRRGGDERPATSRVERGRGEI